MKGCRVKKHRNRAAALAFTLGIAISPLPSFGQISEIATAESALEAASELLGEESISSVEAAVLREIRLILDQIIVDYPASDIAVKILFQDKFGNLDVVALDNRLSEISASENPITVIPQPEVPTATTSDTAVPSGGAETMPFPSIDPAEKTANPTNFASANASASVTGSDFNASDFSTDIRVLAEELNSCYAQGQLNNRVDTQVDTQVITFSIGVDSKLDGVPELVDVDSLEQAGWKIYLNALAALESCSPYPPKYSGHQYDATFDGNALIGLSDVRSRQEPWVASDEVSHRELNLDRRAIAEIQARLSVLGFDPNGIDGVMGRGSRAAIFAWQESLDIPKTGFLNVRQLEKLNEVSALALSNWVANTSNRETLERAGRQPTRTTTTTRRSRNVWYRDRRGMYCKRLVIGSWCQASRPRG